MNHQGFTRPVRHLTLRGGMLAARTRKLPLAAAALFAILACIAAAVFVRPHDQQRPPAPQSQTVPVADKSQPALPIALPAPDQLRQISPEEALKENADRPFTTRTDTPATRFVLKADQISQLRAVDCMAQAIYYEAASEGVDGGRAVAQVVLNRVRHPAYPSSVCGVVYQGSERVTGCQFSFTCDGSLARIPVAYLWQRSMKIAREALAGRVFAPVGHATNYHADYVLPYWADSLDKVIQIGRHIFYRFRGGLGDARIFKTPYAGAEPLPPQPTPFGPSPEDAALDAAIPPDVVTTPLIKVEEDKVVPLAKSPTPEKPKASDLIADANRGELIVAGSTLDGASKSAKPKPTPDTCQKSAGNKIKAVSANDLRLPLDSSGC